MKQIGLYVYDLLNVFFKLGMLVKLLPLTTILETTYNYVYRNFVSIHQEFETS